MTPDSEFDRLFPHLLAQCRKMAEYISHASPQK